MHFAVHAFVRLAKTLTNSFPLGLLRKQAQKRFRGVLGRAVSSMCANARITYEHRSTKNLSPSYIPSPGVPLVYPHEGNTEPKEPEGHSNRKYLAIVDQCQRRQEVCVPHRHIGIKSMMLANLLHESPFAVACHILSLL